MKSLVRFLGLVFLVLTLLLTASLFAQLWLQRETKRLRAETAAEVQVKLDALFALHPLGEADLGAESLSRYGRLLGGHVALSGTPTPALADAIEVAYAVPEKLRAPGMPATRFTVEVPLSNVNRLFLFHERSIVGLLVAGMTLLAATLAIGLVWFFRREPYGASRAPFPSPQTGEVNSLVQLARRTVAKDKELELARASNERTAQDLHLNQQLLSRALEDKAELGRNLHDGVVQSLYAAGLTLEAAQAELAASPDEANKRIGRTLDLLNATIRDVRGYINGLSPEALNRTGFRQALGALADELRAERLVAFDFRIDDSATAALAPAQARELLQIAREAVSNSLRHGKASSVAIYLGLHPESIELLIRDNGAGFDAKQRRVEGHGLRNIEARAALLKGHWELSSTPGKGTVVRLSLPRQPKAAL